MHGFNRTNGSYYKTGVAGSGAISVLVPFGTGINFVLSLIVPVQDMYCDLYYVLARDITGYLQTLKIALVCIELNFLQTCFGFKLKSPGGPSIPTVLLNDCSISKIYS